MDLWIRTQDKEMLTKIEDVSFIKDSQTGTYIILATGRNIPTWHHLHYGGTTILGVYKSKEKALQVLDDIQNLLIQSNKIFIKTHAHETDFKNLKAYLKDCDVIIVNRCDTIIDSVNLNTIVYQMPEDKE